MKPTLHIAIIGEGKNDVGVAGNPEWKEGTVQAYLRRFLEPNFTLEFSPIAVSKKETKNIITYGSGRYRKYKIKGVAKKLYRFLAKYKGNTTFDLLVFFSDTDKTTGIRASEKEATAKYKEVIEHITEGKELLQLEMPNLQVIPMVPVRILECWLLGDKAGFEGLPCKTIRPALPKSPEFIWGDKKDASSDYPKQYLRRILENAKFSDNTETYIRLVEHADFDQLAVSCPLSFKPFYEEIMAYKASR